MRFFILLPTLALAACVETPPPAPSPAMQQLQTACGKGDTQACATIAQMEQRNAEAQRAAIAAMPGFQPHRIDPTPFMQPAPAPMTYQPITMGQTTRCREEWGQLVCRTY